MKYIIIFLLSFTACDMSNIADNSNVTDVRDVIETDTRNYREEVLITRDSSEEDSGIYIKQPDIIVNTNFPEPNWFK